MSAVVLQPRATLLFFFLSSFLRFLLASTALHFASPACRLFIHGANDRVRVLLNFFLAERTEKSLGLIARPSTPLSLSSFGPFLRSIFLAAQFFWLQLSSAEQHFSARKQPGEYQKVLPRFSSFRESFGEGRKWKNWTEKL